jgi:hypothetical protein
MDGRNLNRTTKNALLWAAAAAGCVIVWFAAFGPWLAAQIGK